MKKRVLLPLLVLCLLLVGCAKQSPEIITEPTEPAATFAWEIREGRAVILGIGDITDAHVTIPGQISLSAYGGGYIEDAENGTNYPVSVAGDAFADCDTIESVTFSDGVTVEKNAMNDGETGMFAGCDALTAVYDIPQSVLSMDYAFEQCGALAEVNRLPESLKSMCRCFLGCSSLTAAPEIPSGVFDMSGAFMGCSALTATPAIPKAVRLLIECFRDCTALTEVRTIRAVATEYTLTFAGCTALTQLPDLPDRVSGLDECFRECTALTAVTALPARAISLNRTFYGCTALESFTAALPESVTWMDSTFEKCKALKEFTADLPRGLQSAVDTFRGCVALESMTAIPAEVVALQNRTFMQCNALKSIDVETCPNMDTSEVFQAMTKLNINYLVEHKAKGLCPYCNRVTDTYEIGKLKVYFQNLNPQIIEDTMAAVENEIPEELRNASYCLIMIPENEWEKFEYDMHNYLGWEPNRSVNNDGKCFTKNGISYSAVRVRSNYYDEGMEWGSEELYTTFHELSHAFDHKYNLKSQSKVWIKLHEAEGETIRKKYYNESVYLEKTEEQRRKETFAMASAVYYTAPSWLQLNCPGMYEYMAELWKDAT